MRRIVGMLSELRALQLQRQGLESRIAESREMFQYLDRGLNGLDPQIMPERLGEVMISADFTYAIQEFVQREMWGPYNAKRFAFEPLVKPDTLPNFMQVTRYQNRGSLDDLEYVGEKGEARAGSVDDAVKRQYRVYKWEKQFEFSMETLVNDDIGYLTDQARNMGQAARRTLEKYVSRMYTNATTIARLVLLGALYSTTGRLTSARISTARMAFNQRVDADAQPISATMTYLVYHPGLVDQVRTIRQSQLVPELATNAVNVVAGDFTPIEDPYIAGAAPNLPWYAFTDWQTSGIVPFVLARRQGVPAPMILRKKSDMESVATMLGAGADVAPIMGDFATGNVVIKVHDEWGTYIDTTVGVTNEGNMFDANGCFYSSGTAP